MKSWCLLMTALTVHIGVSVGQTTSSQVCERHEDSAACLIKHIADNFYQQNVQIRSSFQQQTADVRSMVSDTLEQQTSEITNKLERMSYEMNSIVCQNRGSSSDCPECRCDGENLPQHCTDIITTTTYTLPQDCADIRNMGFTGSGVYTVYIPVYDLSNFIQTAATTVYCDMETDGGSWLIFQRRFNGSVDFNRGWDEYKFGFGSAHGELWLGNWLLNRVTSWLKVYQLRIDLEDWEGERRHASYSFFRVGTEATLYSLGLGAYSGDAGDSLSFVANNRFCTPDNRYTGHDSIEAGFWFVSSHWFHVSRATLNNPYIPANTTSDHEYPGIVWVGWHGSNYWLKSVEMKIRPTN